MPLPLPLPIPLPLPCTIQHHTTTLCQAATYDIEGVDVPALVATVAALRNLTQQLKAALGSAIVPAGPVAEVRHARCARCSRWNNHTRPRCACAWQPGNPYLFVSEIDAVRNYPCHRHTLCGICLFSRNPNGVQYSGFGPKCLVLLPFITNEMLLVF